VSSLALTATKNIDFWDVISYSMIKRYESFVGGLSILKMRTVRSPKHWYFFTTRHDVTSQKTLISKELQNLYSPQNII
jgi:hypothetical protein